MTIGWWMLIIGVLLVLSEAPERSMAVIAVGVLPFIVVILGRHNSIAGLVGFCAYLAAVAGTLWLLLPINGDGANLVLLLFMAMLMLLSWPTAFDL